MKKEDDPYDDKYYDNDMDTWDCIIFVSLWISVVLLMAWLCHC